MKQLIQVQHLNLPSITVVLHLSFFPGFCFLFKLFVLLAPQTLPAASFYLLWGEKNLIRWSIYGTLRSRILPKFYDRPYQLLLAKRLCKAAC